MSDYEPQPGDIGLVKMKGSVGSMIRVGQWLNGDGFQDLQHVFVVAGRTEGTGRGWRVVEAMPGGARNSPLLNYPSDKIVWLRCPPDYREAVAAAALKYVNVPYSFADYFALTLHRFHVPTPNLKKFIGKKGSMICSQLADQAAQDGGWHIFADGRWPGYVTPGDLVKVARLQKPGQYVERVKVSR